MKKMPIQLLWLALLMLPVVVRGQLQPPSFLGDVCGVSPTFTGPSPSLITNWCPGAVYNASFSLSAPFSYTIDQVSWDTYIGNPTGISPMPSTPTNHTTFTAPIKGPVTAHTFVCTATCLGPNMVQNGGFDGCGLGVNQYPKFNTQYQDGGAAIGDHHGHIKVGSYYGDHHPGTNLCLPAPYNPGSYNYINDVISRSGIPCNAPGGYSQQLCVRGAMFGTGFGYTDWLGNWHDADNAVRNDPGYFWGQIVDLCHGEKYQFKYYVREMEPCPNSSTVPKIAVAFAGGYATPPSSAWTATNSTWGFTPMDLNVFTPSFPGNGFCDNQNPNIAWRECKFTFTYGGPTGAVFICMYDQNLSGNGNAFSIDDISLNRVCTASTSIRLEPPSSLPTISADAGVCMTDGFSFTVNGTPGNIISYTILNNLTTIASGIGTINSAGTFVTPSVTPGCGALTLSINAIKMPPCSNTFTLQTPITKTVTVYRSYITGVDHLCGIGSTTWFYASYCGPSGLSSSYASSNPAVATVTSAGMVKGISRGTATITYTRGACTSTKNITIYAPNQTITSNMPTTGGCTSGSYHIDIHGQSGDVVTYQIQQPGSSTFGPNATVTIGATNTATIPYTPTVPGTLKVRIIKVVEGPCVFPSLAIEYSVNIIQTPTVGPILVVPLCGGASAWVVYLGLPHAGASYGWVGGTWTNADPAVITGPSATGFIETADIDFDVYVPITYSYSNSCGAISVTTVQPVHRQPKPTVSYSGCTPVCPGVPVTLTIHGRPGDVIHGSQRLSPGTSVSDPDVIMGPSGDYTITKTTTEPTTIYEVTATDPATGCFTNAFFPYPGIAAYIPTHAPGVSIVNTSPLRVCPGQPFQFQLHGDPNSTVVVKDLTGTTFTVTLDASGNGTSPSLTLLANNTYCVKTVTNFNGCCTITAPDPHITNGCIDVVLWPAPALTLSATIPPCSYIPLNLSVSGTACTSYAWFGPSMATVPTPGSTTSISVPNAQSGLYTVTGIESVHGCTVKGTLNVTMPVEPPITGNTTVCIGGTTTLANASPGGTWMGSSSVATINAAGVVTGASVGTALITYKTVAGCMVKTVVTVKNVPTITGPSFVCQGSTISLSADVPGGTWTSSNSSAASVDPTTGIVSGIASFNVVTITYATGIAGCKASIVVTVGLTPRIKGQYELCPGETATLNVDYLGGSWTSSDPGIAYVSTDLTGGAPTYIVNGVSGGTATLTYNYASCIATVPVVVDPAPYVCWSVIDHRDICLPDHGAECDEWFINASPGATVSYQLIFVDPVTLDHHYCWFTTIGTGSDEPVTGTDCMGTYPFAALNVSDLYAYFGKCRTTVCYSSKPAPPNSNVEKSAPLSIVPNPTSGIATLSGGNPGLAGVHTAVIDIVDMAGKVIYSSSVNVTDGSINEKLIMSELPDGLYLVKVSTSSFKQTLKVTVAH